MSGSAWLLNDDASVLVCTSTKILILVLSANA